MKNWRGQKETSTITEKGKKFPPPLIFIFWYYHEFSEKSISFSFFYKDEAHIYIIEAIPF
jgi:hypothetical protein